MCMFVCAFCVGCVFALVCFGSCVVLGRVFATVSVCFCSADLCVCVCVTICLCICMFVCVFVYLLPCVRMSVRMSVRVNISFVFLCLSG